MPKDPHSSFAIRALRFQADCRARQVWIVVIGPGRGRNGEFFGTQRFEMRFHESTQSLTQSPKKLGPAALIPKALTPKAWP